MSSTSSIGKINWKYINTIDSIALDKANKPVFLFGKASWSTICDHMLREISGDEKILSLLDRTNCALIDLDERPDLFARYNSGALPSIILLTPQLEPILATTYMTIPELSTTLHKYLEMYDTKAIEAKRLINEREEKIRKINEQFYIGQIELNESIFQRTVKGIVMDFDHINGGFGKSPKLALPTSVEVLMEAYTETGGNDFEGILSLIYNNYLTKGLFDRETKTFFRGCVDEALNHPIPERLSFESISILKVLMDIDTLLMKNQSREALLTMAKSFIDLYYDNNEKLFRLSDTLAIFHKDINCIIADRLCEISKVNSDTFLTDMAKSIAERCLVSNHNLKERKGTKLLRDEVNMFKLTCTIATATNDDYWYRKSVEIKSSIMQNFYKNELKGLADVDSIKPDEGINFYQKDIEDNGIFSQCCVELYKIDKDRSHLDLSKDILSHFPDQGGGYGHWTANYALATINTLKAWEPH